jgi:hypothetical protein
MRFDVESWQLNKTKGSNIKFQEGLKLSNNKMIYPKTTEDPL